MSARPLRSCSSDEVGCVHDTVEISPRTGPSGGALALAMSSATLGVNASFVGGANCFACCSDCASFVHYCTKEAGHSGAHTCPKSHSWF